MIARRSLVRCVVAIVALGTISVAAPAQSRSARTAVAPSPSEPQQQFTAFDQLAFAGLRWREIGPYRGGRSVAATGSAVRPREYYMGTTGGGVFKTVDGGNAWFPVTDKYFGGTIGAIAVAPSNPDVVYVGGGEYPIRGNVSHGDGVWRTTDGAKTWTFLGLGDSRQIAAIVVHPTNPDLVYVGVFGHFWASNPTRGVFRSRDGGKTWQKVLFRNDSTGVADLVMDPSDPNILYASLWQAYRLPWTFSSGGVGSGLFKSTDGGDHWTEITRNPGLPAGMWGNVGLTISAASPKRIWALIEAKESGLYRSDDAGATWTAINITDNEIKQRAWYYMKVTADPADTSVLYINNVSFLKSADGGKTFRPLRGGMRHGDSHHLWIAPNDSRRMIETDDGGAEVTTDGGTVWTEEDFATAQFYHVIATTHFPYHVCGAQQDNSTLCGASRGSLDTQDWTEAGGGESGWIAARADDPDIVYAGSYGNLLTRKDMRTGFAVNVNPWPDNPMGHPARDLKYRFQWTFPIIVSPHSSAVVYAGSQYVHKSTDAGRSWTVISPDLTYHDPATLGDAGGPITKDQTSVEYYGVVFVIAESPLTRGELWTGSDDGKVYVTRDAGKTWTDVTPKDMAKFTRVSSIDPSAHVDGVAYVAANRYQMDDNKPYLWKTADFGKTWTRIESNLPDTVFTRVVREDPGKRGLLVAGTERGIWFSPNDGRRWQSLQLNLPPVPVHDLVFKDGDIVLATHGRGFQIMDNISSLRQVSAEVLASNAFLYKPLDQYRVAGGGRGGGGGGGAGRGGRGAEGGVPEVPVHPVGENPPAGIVVQYWLKSAGQTVAVEFLDAKGQLIHKYSTADTTRPPDAGAGGGGRGGPAAPPRVPNRAGVNTFTGWNMRYEDASTFRGMVLWAANTTGPLAPPGTYQVRLTVDGKTIGMQSFKLLADPRLKGVSQADYDAQFALLMKVRDKFSQTNDAVKTARYVKHELEARGKELPTAQQGAFNAIAGGFADSLTSVEDSLYQGQSHASEDPLNYPIRLNNRIGALLGVVGSADGRPTKQSYEVYDMLSGLIDGNLVRMKKTIDINLPKINAILKAAGLPEIVPKAEELPLPAARGPIG